MYNIVVLWFSDFVECISNAINKTTRQQNNQTTKQLNNTNVFFTIDILFPHHIDTFQNNLTTIYCDKQADSCRNVA